MPYSHKSANGAIYFLHEKKTVLRNGFKRTVYFFAKDKREGYLEELPVGWYAVETRTGLPFLKERK